MNTSQPGDLRFASALSTLPVTSQAVEEAARNVADQLDGRADLVVVFVSADRRDDLQQIGADLGERFGPCCLVGCTGESIVGVGREIEGRPAVSLWAARLPETNLLPMRLTFEQSPEGGAIVGWPDGLPERWPESSFLLMLGEPFSFPTDALLQRLNEDQPGVPVIGGMASGGHAPRENRLLLGEDVYEEGAVVVMIHGGVRLRPVVSQGCRPIGRHFVITKAERNVI